MARLRNRKFILVINLALVAGIVAAAPSVGRYLREFESDDPFRELLKGSEHDPSFAMRMDNVQMKHYDHGKLVTFADCNSVDLGKDHHTYNMNGVHDALYRGDQGSFRYAADRAVFIEGAQLVNAFGKVHIKNGDLDLTAKSMQIEGRKHTLRAFGDVMGKAKGGDTKVSNVVYNFDTGAYSAGPVEWKGKLALNMQDPDEGSAKPRAWEIRGAKVAFSGRGTEIATYDNAVAADGEIILVAPKVEHNRRTDVVTATGRVQYFSGRANIVADQCVVYRKEKRAVLIGNVLMYVRPKKNENDKPKVEPMPSFQPMNPDQVTATPIAAATEQDKQKAKQIRDSNSLQEFPMIINSAKIEYWYGKGSRRAVITGAPQARQELPESAWRFVWTNVAFYDGEKETLKLVSTKGLKDTRMKNSIGDDLTADWMVVSTKENDDSMNGNGFLGTVMSLDDDDLSRKKPADGKPADPKPTDPKVVDPNKPPVDPDKKVPPPKK